MPGPCAVRRSRLAAVPARHARRHPTPQAGGQPAWGVGCRRACRAGTAASRERRTTHGPGIPEKSRGLLRHRESEPVEAYRVMDTEKATHEITRMASLLGVSRSGYYAWTQREGAGPSLARQRRERLTAKITKFHADSDHVYGSPRILADLREDGQKVSGKTVAKLMRAAGIVGISPRRFTPVTTIAGPDRAPVPDLVRRVFDQGRLDAVWTSNITYLHTDQGWLCLCAIRDGCSRRVIGWAIDDHQVGRQHRCWDAHEDTTALVAGAYSARDRPAVEG